MKANQAKLHDFLKKSSMQLIVPVYQRNYSWTERECRQLWEDILRVGRDDNIKAHFIGSIVYIEDDSTITEMSSLLVIDGQQRLTTVMLILEVLARCLEGSASVVGFSSKKLRHNYLLNPNEGESDEKYFKLKLAETDKESLFALMRQKNLPTDHSLRIAENFAFFENKMRSMRNNLEPLCKGLLKLMIVDIALSRDQDNPQLIFESMNSTGRELSQGDLIRNFLLMGLDPDIQTRLYKDHWRPMETAFGQEAYGKLFSRFIRDYLTLQNNGEIPVMKRVYETFKNHAESKETEILIADISKYADYYCAMALDKETDKFLAAAFRDLRELKADVAFPLLLKMYRDYKGGVLEREDFCEAVRTAESYVFRRAACAIPTNSLNQTFSVSLRNIDEKCYLESLQAYFLNLSSYRRFPRDKEFKDKLSNRDLYNFPRRSYWLRRLENHHRKIPISLSDYTIEHVMPQKKPLPKKWQEMLGPDWQKIQETYLHTLGNLTLTGYNSEYGNRPFDEKRNMKDFGFRYSPLWLNKELGKTKSWDKNAILKHAERLAERAVEVWKLPELANLKDYQSSSYHSPGDPSDGHKHLTYDSRASRLFETLRREILAIDSCISEESLGDSVVYKAETDFAEIVPQENELLVLFNVHFHELYNPSSLVKSVINKGRSKNCGVEMVLAKHEDLPQAVALAHQAFEKQMETGETDA